MQRICTSLAANGFDVLLIGRKLKTSISLDKKIFRQKRIQCLFNNGFLFYAEYNIRLFFVLLFIKSDLFCAIDLDTILPVYAVATLRNKKKVQLSDNLSDFKKKVKLQSIKKHSTAVTELN